MHMDYRAHAVVVFANQHFTLVRAAMQQIYIAANCLLFAYPRFHLMRRVGSLLLA